MRPSTKARLVRSTFLSVPLAVLLPMLAAWAGWPKLATVLDAPFALLCHRLPARTLSLAHVSMPLCSRCSGLWLGFSIAAFFAAPAFPLPTLRWIVLFSALLLAVEIVTQDLHLHPVWHATRLLSGIFLAAPLGGTLGAVVTRELGARVDS